MRVTASAPGKLVLLGDHAVVYGYPGLVTAVDLRYQVDIAPTDRDVIAIDTPELRERGEIRRFPVAELATLAENTLPHAHRPETAFVEAALARVFAQYGIPTGLTIRTDGPKLSYGLGSSSAITVATVAALVEWRNGTTTPKDIFDLASAAVFDVQGKGSGVDVAAAVYGGTIYYIKDQIAEPLALERLPLVIGYSGAKVGTVNLIDQVAQLRTRQPQAVNPIFALMGVLADDAKKTLLNGNWAALGDLVNIQQGLLDALGVNTPRLAELVFAARAAGALGAKLAGAGGGDCLFAVVDAVSQISVENALRQRGAWIDVKPHAPGLIVQRHEE